MKSFEILDLSLSEGVLHGQSVQQMHFFKSSLKQGSAQLSLVSLSPVACRPCVPSEDE